MDLFKNFNEIYKCEHDFIKIINELNSNHYNRTDGMSDDLEREDIIKLIAYMKPLMINATDRNVINHDNFQFYFNTLLTLNNIKIQNDALTKVMIMGKCIKSLSTIGGTISSGLNIFSYNYPDIISRNAGSVAMGASTMLSRVNT